jgi:hypothetical protein
MFRPKASVYLLAMIAVAALSGCSSPNAQEENIVRQYFRASSLRDNQTLANFAVVNFDPKTDGVVTDFDVTSVSPERTEPIKVRELAKVFQEAEAANKAFNEKKKTYQDANLEAIDRVLKAESAGRKLSGKDAQIQAEWTKWRDETSAEAKKLSAARTALADARPIAELSLTGAGGEPPALDTMDGMLASKDINVSATVRGPDGSTSQKNYVITVQRAVVKGSAGERTGKWIVTSVKPA